MNNAQCPATSRREPIRLTPRWFLPLALILPLGCSSKPSPDLHDLAREGGKRARATVIEQVPDTVRREEALRLVDIAIAIELEFMERQDALRGEIFELNADYDSDRVAFRRTYDELSAIRAVAIDDMLGPLGALEVVLTPEEWSAVVSTLEENQGNWSASR